MERRVRWKSHARCETGEKTEIASISYLSSLLFANEYSANFLYELYKRARKWGGVPTGITQNVEDLLKSETARSMLSNTDFVMMLNQATSDRVQLAKLLNISDNLLTYVTNSESGQGLICCGGSIIPFRDKFPKNDLYRLMTSNLSELSEYQKREWSKCRYRLNVRGILLLGI